MTNVFELDRLSGTGPVPLMDSKSAADAAYEKAKKDLAAKEAKKAKVGSTLKSYLDQFAISKDSSGNFSWKWGKNGKTTSTPVTVVTKEVAQNNGFDFRAIIPAAVTVGGLFIVAKMLKK